MHSTTVTPWQNCCYCPVPSRFTSPPHSLPFPIRLSRLTLSAAATTHSCSTEHEKQKHPRNPEDPDRENPVFPQDYYEDGDGEPERRFENPLVFLTNMWWADMKAALGQRINVEGLTSSLGIFAKNKHLVIPHIAVPDIRYIDWAELKRRGFEGVVFDKDNTLTVPYSLRLWPPLRSSIEQCKALFGNNIAVFSNSAGLFEYDPDGRNAKILERAIGIKVIRHRVKKPAGTAEEIERQFGCESSKLIMVGDRPFTDIVYGNRNGFLTILTEPLSLAEEPFIVQQGYARGSCS
ncbi:PREDICTED: phosphatidylglycerophosphatase GEP4, mitochondrial-like isoform X2 [Ipomoea nil]|uniref:phosphatidylglycerophosphatase GEP4, mitochondrial-like isoform X2 n=1 Tax=Ipomoea nil TaxID=35883 RepID=UPI0009017B93|nr:PREDICTED: phosphatidylglycerophosphatase GEP4, mitochondrial-like isoform X2 [Ipomoea nil]